jgi:hypothetical protein
VIRTDARHARGAGVRRRAELLTIAATAVLALGAVGNVFASNPKPGATYAGKVPERLTIKPGTSAIVGKQRVKFTVTGNGKHVKRFVAHFATNGCQGGEHNSTVDTDIGIVDGVFRDKGSYDVNGFTDHVKIRGAFVKHGKAADVRFHWSSSQPDCPAGVTDKGRVHVK